jgi:hypothetical protein
VLLPSQGIQHTPHDSRANSCSHRLTFGEYAHRTSSPELSFALAVRAYIGFPFPPRFVKGPLREDSRGRIQIHAPPRKDAAGLDTQYDAERSSAGRAAAYLHTLFARL